jgi:hypothetical protein
MTTHIHYQRISSYRELPPRWKIVQSEDSQSPERYISRIDQTLKEVQDRLGVSDADYTSNLVAAVFGNQMVQHEVNSQHLAHVIQERRALAKKHLEAIQWRLDPLLEQRPIRSPNMLRSPQEDRAASEMERQILDLERQKRDVERALWLDILELRAGLNTERQEAGSTRRRIGYLGGTGLGYGQPEPGAQ